MITHDGREAMLRSVSDENGCDRCCFVWADENCKIAAHLDRCAAGCEGHFRYKDAGNTAHKRGASELEAAMEAARACRTQCEKETV